MIATPDIEFTVIGKAEPAGSKRGFKHPATGHVVVVDANRNAKPWQAAVASAGAEAMAGRLLFDGPLSVEFVFYQPRPRGHFGTGRNARWLRPSAPAYPTGRPDVLKLARGVEDALTGICWRDDARIVQERLVKFYGEPPRVDVRVSVLPAAHVVDLERGAGTTPDAHAPAVRIAGSRQLAVGASLEAI